MLLDLALVMGFVLTFAGLAVGFSAVYEMIDVINNESLSQVRIPRWGAFTGVLSSKAIRIYRSSHKDGSLNRLLQFSWILIGLGFVLVIGSRLLARL